MLEDLAVEAVKFVAESSIGCSRASSDMAVRL
jgi:hypothetical protein